ncbi:RICIN domain-containing protein [Streptomyces longwoodensis]|uniref:RICIN domain-containing protein n=1 Tax=Streptomyces longwoodensis TaxID=68231 RepID=UPI0022557A5C|nr:RICIN domain-containing protein [Streptomyces longwoodensis]MCX4999569.1 RICIN domain-containing protein [Streptomyces longwoodensis]WRY87296.1 RICIN domain-containing protein [Streptomyces longwoodensis]WUC61045.1 RICIN domain-containing protein [Streptomyces longwoodensis]
MSSPHPPRPPYPPRPGRPPGDSDRALAAEIAAGRPARAVPLLLARHWRPAHDYAAVCLASDGTAAELVAATAFHQVLGRLERGRPGGALRPQILVAVRDTVREWAGAEGVPAVLPAVGRTTGGRGLRAARAGTPERRQLAERAFQSLPPAAQCLLWHTEVEADPISVPAGLSGIDGITATAALEQAREQFRALCVRAHRDLAPTRECRFHNRLVDILLRRGAGLLPDVRRHLAECRYCRHAAEQLSHFDGALDVLLAETVLGWGARRYLDSRPGRATAPGARRRRTAPRAPLGRHRSAPAAPRGATARGGKGVLLGVGLTSLALLAAFLVGRGWADDSGVPVPGATWGAPVAGTTAPGGSSGHGPTSADPAGHRSEIARGRLRVRDGGLCLDVEDRRVRAGARVVLADCSGAASQQWSYRSDGLLRNLAAPALAPGLCLTADPVRRDVTLDGCASHAGEVFYDVTVRGELLLRHGDGLVVVPAPGGSGHGVAVRERDGSARQRWRFDTAPAPTGPGNGPAAPPAPGLPSRSPTPLPTGGAPVPAPRSAPRSAAPPAAPHPAAPPSLRPPTAVPPSPYETRVAQVSCCEDTPETPKTSRPAPVPGSVDRGSVVAGAVGAALEPVLGLGQRSASGVAQRLAPGPEHTGRGGR